MSLFQSSAPILDEVQSRMSLKQENLQQQVMPKHLIITTLLFSFKSLMRDKEDLMPKLVESETLQILNCFREIGIELSWEQLKVASEAPLIYVESLIS